LQSLVVSPLLALIQAMAASPCALPPGFQDGPLSLAKMMIACEINSLRRGL
jgi:hypothetical protein